MYLMNFITNPLIRSKMKFVRTGYLKIAFSLLFVTCDVICYNLYHLLRHRMSQSLNWLPLWLKCIAIVSASWGRVFPLTFLFIIIEGILPPSFIQTLFTPPIATTLSLASLNLLHSSLLHWVLCCWHFSQNWCPLPLIFSLTHLSLDAIHISHKS